MEKDAIFCVFMQKKAISIKRTKDGVLCFKDSLSRKLNITKVYQSYLSEKNSIPDWVYMDENEIQDYLVRHAPKEEQKEEPTYEEEESKEDESTYEEDDSDRNDTEEYDDDVEMDADEFAQFACKYASEIDCSITGKSMLALYERIEMMEEDGVRLTQKAAVDLIEEAADKAEKKTLGRKLKSIFSPAYDKEGFLILREKDFFD